MHASYSCHGLFIRYEPYPPPILLTNKVREALMFAAMLKLPSSMALSEKQGRALDIAEMLNIKKSLDNVVGSSLVKGISGEQGISCLYLL